MIDVNEKLTSKVAHLARLALSEAEIHTFTPQLKEILKYVEKLQEVDVSDIEPMVHPFDAATPLRPDQPNPFPLDKEGKPKVLDAAPEVLYDGFKVPPIL